MQKSKSLINKKLISLVLVITMFVTNVPFNLIEKAEVSALTNADIKLPEVSGSTRIDTDPSDGITGEYVVIQNTGTTTQSSGNLEGIVTSREPAFSHYPDLDELELMGDDFVACGSGDLPIEDLPKDSLLDKITNLFSNTTSIEYQVGQTRDFYMTGTSVADKGDKTFELRALTDDCYIWVEEGGTNVSNSTAQQVADDFDDYYNNILKPTFGEFYDKDGSGRVNILIYLFKSGYSPSGFFYTGDYSLNDTQIIHVDSDRYTLFKTHSNIISNIAVHEMQHLINYNQNYLKKDAYMDSWLNEGLSMASSEMFKRGSDLSDRLYYYLLNIGKEISNGKAVIDFTGDYYSYSISCLFTAYLNSQAGEEVFKKIYENYTGDEHFAVANSLKQIGYGDYDFYDILLAFQLAVTMNDSTGLYGFNSDYLFDSITPQLYTGTITDIPAGGSIVIQLEEGTIFEPDFTNSGKDVRFVGVGELDAYKPTIIDKPEDNYIVIDEEHQLNLYAGGVTDVIWSSSNTTASTIDENTGLLTAIGVGETVIKATSKENADIFDTYNLTVKDKVITINQSNYYIAIDGTRTVTATTRPVGEVIWSVDDTSIATIDKDTGIITPISAGTFKVTATYLGSEHIVDTMEFEVLDELYPGLEVDFVNKRIDVLAGIGMETLGKMSEGYYTTSYDSDYNFDNSLTDVTINQTVDLTLIDHTPIGSNTNQFKGTYNGNGFVINIKSLGTVATGYQSFSGVFAVNTGTINDINILVTDGTIIETDAYYVGLVCGLNNGIINHSIVTISKGSSIRSTRSIGAIFGEMYSYGSAINNPVVEVMDYSSIEGYSVGGVGGVHQAGIIESPTVTISNSSFLEGSWVGGVVGSYHSYYDDGRLDYDDHNLSFGTVNVVIENDSYISGAGAGGVYGSVSIARDELNAYLSMDVSVKLNNNSHITGSSYSGGLFGYSVVLSSDPYYSITGGIYMYISEGSSIKAENYYASALLNNIDNRALLKKQNPSDEMQITLEIYGDVISSNGTASVLVSNNPSYMHNNNIFPEDATLLPDITITLGPNAIILNGDGSKGVLFYDDTLLGWDGSSSEYTGSRDTFVYAVPYDSEYKGFAYDDSTSNRIEYPHENNPTPSISLDYGTLDAINSNNTTDPNGVFIKSNDLANKNLIIDATVPNDDFDLTATTITSKEILMPPNYYEFSLIADGLPINVPAYFATEDLVDVIIEGVDPTVVYDNHFEAYTNLVDDEQNIKITFTESNGIDWNIYRMENLTDIFDYDDELSVLTEITPTVTQVDDDITLIEFSIDVDGLYAIEAYATSKIESDKIVEDIKYIYLGQEIGLPAEPILPDDLEFTIKADNANTNLHLTEELANTNAVPSNTTQSVEIQAENGYITNWTLYKDGVKINNDITITEDKQVETHYIKFSVTDDGLYQIVGSGVSLYDDTQTSTLTYYFTINEPTKELVLDISSDNTTLYENESDVVSVQKDVNTTITATNGYIDDFTVYRDGAKIDVQYMAMLSLDDKYTNIGFTVSDAGMYKVVANAKSDKGQTATDTKYFKIEYDPLTPIISLNITGSNIESSSSSANNNPATSSTVVTISASNDNIDTWTVTKDSTDITSSLGLTTDTDIVKLFTLSDDGLYVITATTDTGVTSTRYLCIETPIAPVVTLNITGSNIESSSSSANNNPATSSTVVTISASNDNIDTWTVTKDGNDITSSLGLTTDTDTVKLFTLSDDGLYVITATTDTGVTSSKYLCIETPAVPVVSLSITGSNIENSSSSATSNPTTSSVVTISSSNDNITSWSVTNDGKDITSSINLTSDSNELKVFTLSSDGLYVITATTDTGVTNTKYLYIQNPTVSPPTISLNISGENVYTSQSSAESNPATSSRIVTITSSNDDIYSWSISRNGVDITDSVTIYTNNSDEKILYLNQSGLYEINATTDNGSISSTKYLNISITNYTNPFLEIQGRHVMFTENEALNNPTQTRETVVVFCENGYINDVDVYLNNNLVNINYEQNNSNYKVFSLSNPGLYTINATATSNATVSVATENGSLIRDLSIKPLSFINSTSSTPSTISRTKYLYITEPIIVTPPTTNNYVNVTYIANEGGLINGYSFQSILRFANTNLVTAVPVEGFEFVSWSDGLTTPTRMDYNVSNDMTVFAIFKSIHNLLPEAPQTGSKLVTGIYCFMLTLLGAIVFSITLIIKRHRRTKRIL